MGISEYSPRSGEGSTSNLGKCFILPASFLGSKRYMQQGFQDALAICRYIGHPDIFLTMATNPMWDEIVKMMNNLPGCLTVDSRDIIARVFKLKLDQIVEDIKNKAYFGVCVASKQYPTTILNYIIRIILLDFQLYCHSNYIPCFHL